MSNIPRKKRTITDIAKELGVSKSMISRVINNKGYVAPEKRMIIKRFLKDVGYIPNFTARSLAHSRTFSIGLVIPSVAGPFYSEVIRGVEDVLASEHYFTSLFTLDSRTDLGTDVREAYTLAALEKRVDGMIIFDSEISEEQVETFTSRHVPVILLDYHGNNQDIDWISIDNFRGSYSMMMHLIKVHGFKDIAFVGGPALSFDGNERLKGYTVALNDVGIPIRNDMIFHNDFTREGAYKITDEILESCKPQAIFAANDETALGIMEKMKERGIIPGKDIAVVGFDDVIWAKFVEPGITTVHQPMYSLGRLAAETILKRIQGTVKEEITHLILPTRVVVRRSCGCRG